MGERANLNDSDTLEHDVRPEGNEWRAVSGSLLSHVENSVKDSVSTVALSPQSNCVYSLHVSITIPENGHDCRCEPTPDLVGSVRPVVVRNFHRSSGSSVATIQLRDRRNEPRCGGVSWVVVDLNSLAELRRFPHLPKRETVPRRSSANFSVWCSFVCSGRSQLCDERGAGARVLSTFA